MIEDYRLSKINILIQQKKYSDAEKILSNLMAEEPNNVQYLFLMAELNLQQDRFDHAENLLNSAVALSPDTSILFYSKSRVAIQRSNFAKAEEYIKQAIEIDTDDADYHALLSNIMIWRKSYEKALEIANHALSIDAENISALNARSTALNKLDRADESFQTIEGALREDPNNPYTHTNYGWALLEQNQHKKALEHFKEALSQDPTYEYAKMGMLEAIKAKNPVYRAFLKYAFWMNNLTEKYQWGVIIGFYLLMRLLNRVARESEVLQPFLTPLVFLLAIIAFSTWVITPISNLFLRFNKYGQLLLDKSAKMSSNFVAVSFAFFIAGLVSYLIFRNDTSLVIAIFGFTMMVPFSVMFSPSKYKNALLIYAILMAIVGLLAIAVTFLSNEMFNIFSTIYIFGFIAFQWIANFLAIKQDNR